MANTKTCLYIDNSQLDHFINKHDFANIPNLLVQVFSSRTERSFLQQLQNLLKDKLPFSIIVGCTSAGEIYEGEITSQEALLSFTEFEKTELKSVLLHQDYYENSYEMGKSLGEQLVDYDTKAIIIFPTGKTVDSQSLLDGIHNTSPDVNVAGAISGNTAFFNETFSFTKDEMTNEGVAAVAFQNEQLMTHSFSNYEFQKIGKNFTITKANENIIYTIDKKKPLHILRNYLGEKFTETFPDLSFEFPFVMNYKGEEVSLFILEILKNGAIRVNRKVKEGHEITFSYTNIEAMIEGSINGVKKLAKKQVDTIFVYNSETRKRFVPDFTEQELLMLQSIAPTNGFFSFGELSSGKTRRPRLLGLSLTYLALSENSNQKLPERKLTFKYSRPDHLKTLSAFNHLLEATQNDVRQLHENLKLSEKQYESLFNMNSDFIFSTDLQGQFTSVNPAFEKMFGYQNEELFGKSALHFIANEDLPKVRMHFLRALKGKEQYYNSNIKLKSGETNLFQLKNIPIIINGECVGIYGIGRNISEQKKIEDKIMELAYYDHDTGLPNRMKFTEQLENMLVRAKKKKRMLAVLSIDMDRFKLINDSLGHYAGDSILKELAYRIEKILPSGSYIGRFGGDKFTVILSKDVNIDDVMKVSKSILQEIANPVFHEGQDLFITASIGVSSFPEDGLDEQTLLKNADIAANLSKNHGGNRVTFFSTDMNDKAMNRLELESYLRKALQKNEFYLMYQPLIDLHTGEIFGSEALIRWNHPKHGLVSPADFIPLAEETGLIEEIGNWVLRTACMQNKKWQLLGNEYLSVSVNVSAYQFQQTGFLHEVKQALRESNLSPQYLTLELTESTMLSNVDYSIKIMQALQKIGVKVSIDDFGTGYSSLSYLKDLPINTLKIDRSFINNLRVDTSDIAIVKAIITMGHGLDVKVLAEGVETKEQIELLKELNCHYAQGFYIHRPLLSTDFEKGLTKE
ncbi:EAL domain-containing protein [Bacillus sp. Bva_UNVM-123]|uniref:bifunctional diguanylate cyclase/phosphodiesterase n=1 Tax=Bacillus sp. Bva_UNVM-123 TaxID=2829798 RepID=UPI00391F1E03